MDMNRMTLKLQEALQAASTHAMRRSHQDIDVEHLLLALMEQEAGLSRPLFEQAGVSPTAVQKAAEAALDRLPQVQGPGTASGHIYVTQRLSHVLTQAEQEMRGLHDEYVSIEHILLAMVGEGGILRQLGLTRERLLSALQQIRGNQRVTSQDPESTYQALEKYGRDLTRLGACPSNG